MKKVIALVDCNNFFASCERLFNPAYIGRPIVILSNNDGCVISRSNEAKALGIPMGAPYFKFEDICKAYNVIIHSSNFELYGDISNRVMATLSVLAPNMEVYSIDEAFLDLSGIPDPYGYCVIIRQRVLQWTGIPVSIGLSSTKTLAKAAGEVAKKSDNGVCELSHPEIISQVLQSLSVSDVWGIGRKWGAKLEQKFRIKTAYDLKQANAKFIREHFSVIGERIIYELNGLSCLEPEECASKKSISSTRSFGKVVTELKDLREAVATYASIAAKKLRKQSSKAYAMYVYIRTNHFRDEPQYMNSKIIELAYPSSDTRTLIVAALTGLESIYKPGYQYKKAGVVLLNIVPANHMQQDILQVFDQEREQKSVALMQAIDDLNTRYSKTIIRYAAEGFKKEWKVKSELLSPRYTTRWEELALVY